MNRRCRNGVRHDNAGGAGAEVKGKTFPLPIYNKKKYIPYWKFITEVAKSMETKEEISTRMGTARREGIAIGKRKGRAEGRALERKRQLAIARGLYKKGVALSVLASSFNYTEKQIAG